MPSPRRAALIIGHPGHELRLHHWLEVTKPTVFVLTDGSGHDRHSRLASTDRVLKAAGALPGTIYGRFTDAELYAAIRTGNMTALFGVLRELADALSDLAVDYVVGDALEGFNPSHDLCRFLINAAVLLIQKDAGHKVGNFEVLLDGGPDVCAKDLQPLAIRVDLDQAALQRKLAAAYGYPELREEIDLALTRFGSRAFATEYLRPVADLQQGLDAMNPEPPFYETFGERQVRARIYDHVIRYRDHVRPLINLIWHQAGLSPASLGVTRMVVSAMTGVSSRSNHLTRS